MHTETQKTDLIEAVVNVAQKRLAADEDQARAVADFVRHYFAYVPPQDICGVKADTLFGAAFAHWRLAGRRPTGSPIVRVYNPRLDEHGWRSDHTVVEVVNDDMPFLVDSVTAALNQRGMTVHVVIHPIFGVMRDDDGNLKTAGSADRSSEAAIAESFMHVEVTEQADDALSEIAADVTATLADVRAAVEDWEDMRARLRQVIDALHAADEDLVDELDETRQFLLWLHDDNFTFLGYREYVFDNGGRDATAAIVTDAGLGLVRDARVRLFRDLRNLAALPAEVRAFVAKPDLLIITKSDRVSTVHRSVPMDAVTVKRFDTDGRVAGMWVFAGLFTAGAYNRSARDIPLLRRKINAVVERAGFQPRSHNGKALINILETFPRDELLQVSAAHLFQTGLGILHLQERQRVALFLRRDDFERYVTGLVYIPRDGYDTNLRLKIQRILEHAFAGTVMSHRGELGDSPLARLYVVVQTTPGEIPDYDADQIEAQIYAASRTWSDHLQDSLTAAHGEELGQRLYQRYADAFPPGYTERFNADEAVLDIDHLDAAMASGEMAMALYRPFEAAEHAMRFKVYHPDAPIFLSDILPMLEHMGLRVIDEVPHSVRVGIDSDRRTVMVHDFGLETTSGGAIDLGATRDLFLDAFGAVWRGQVESDEFNALVLSAGLSCRQIVVLRAYARYLRQTGIAFSLVYMARTMAANAGLARLMVDLFEALFDPTRQPAAVAAVTLRDTLAAELDAVDSADEDRILRRFLNVIECTMRTNYFREGTGGDVPYLAFKIDSSAVDDLPLPRPMVEVFVYSPRMEGIHLRGGRVARGGIRWSDRREDFRTEILGLMKAQMVKNAVIVPVGAKGGFVVKRPPTGDREAQLAEGIACYETLIRGLLDLTDNRVGDGIVPPPDVVRRDDDDPYLVVAADKGTATFSDIANGISTAYGFWLGDAFASGGSQGYDHKKMGITARGAWESVKRHFREMNVDCQAEDFTVVGVGDMSGDVFGNGMLLSPHIRLIAAFNHLHVFVDPDPDAAAGLEERKRLFELPRSSWSDYDPAVLSAGGAVFDRRAKSITLSSEICERFGINASRVTPNELIRAILRAEVDLLWFGGIGTYVKAPEETHPDAGDRANDALRVDANQLRCKVVGEGANLALTQRARIAFARAGGRVNADFIDNSAGVDCSDHEVNIKILLDSVVADGDMTDKQRNTLLAEMTDEVAQLVLRNTYLQTQAITRIEAAAADVLDNQIRLIRFLERQVRLNRAVEFLPDDEELAERAAARQGLCRPEIAVLMSYSKIWLYDELLRSDLPDDPTLIPNVIRYFPTPLRQRFADGITGHRLRRELIATLVTNSLVNRVGGTFLTELIEKSGRSTTDIARAYMAARDVFEVRDVWAEIEALDNEMPAATQTLLQLQTRVLLEHATLWFLEYAGSKLDIGDCVAGFRAGVAALAAELESLLPEAVGERVARRADGYRSRGVPEALARRVASMIEMASACDVVRIAADHGLATDAVARLYFAVGEYLSLGWLRDQAEALSVAGYWQKLAVAAVVQELYDHQRVATRRVLDAAGGAEDGAIEAWAKTCRPAVERTRTLVGELETTPPVDLSMLTVASRQLRALTGS